jgi:hypothetical protein
MTQWQEDLAVALLPLTHGFLHDRYTTRVGMLIPQAIKDSLRRVTLLQMNIPVTLQDLLNHRQEQIQLRWPRLRQPILRWLAVSQNLGQRVPVNAILGTRGPLTQFAVQNATANLNPLLHISEHPCLPQKANSNDFGTSESLKKLPQVSIWALRFLVRLPLTARRYVF